MSETPRTAPWRGVLVQTTRKELREIVRDGRFWTASLILLGLLAVALAFGARQAAATRAERAAAQRTADEHFATQEEKNPHAAAHYGAYVFKPAGALPFLDPGVEPHVGVSVKLEAHRRNAAEGSRARDSVGLSRFGRFDAGTVLQLLGPLLVVGIGFSSWSAERERGTLRLLVASGASLTALFVAKVAGLAAALGLVALPAIVLGGAAIAWVGGGAGAAPLDRALALVVVHAAYFGVFVAATLAASARAPSSRSALVALLGLWVGWTLVVPRVAADAASLFAPTPTSAAFAEDVKRSLADGLPGGPSRDERVESLTTELMEQRGYSGAETLMAESLLGALELDAETRFENEVLDHHFEQLERAVERQDRLLEWAALASPTVAMRALSMALAGTDSAHHRHFAAAAEAHRRELVDALNRELGLRGGADPWAYVAGRETWERMPRFSYERPRATWALRGRVVSASLLAGWLVVSLALALGASRRIRVV